MAESTGRFPPTPTDRNAANTPIAAKFGDPAAMKPKTAVTPVVRLNAHRRPKRRRSQSPKTQHRRAVQYFKPMLRKEVGLDGTH